jgi:hypothetical protein
MQRRVKRSAIIGLAGVTLAAGGGIAVATTSGSSPEQERQALLDDAAKKLGKTPDEVTQAFRSALKDRLDAQVKAGTITQAQADEILKRAQNGVPGFGPGGPGGFGRHGGPGFGPGAGFSPREAFAAAAKALGISTDKLETQLRAGKSLADIAKAQGKDVADLKATLTAAAKDRIAKAVKDKQLTQAQADELSKDLADRISDLVDGKRPTPPKGFGRHGHGPGGGGFGRGGYGPGAPDPNGTAVPTP